MELMVPQVSQSRCQSGYNLAMSLSKETKINELCNLPDLEITPVVNAGNKKNIAESKDRSSSLEEDTLKEKILKEKNDMENLLKRLPILDQYFKLHSKIGEGTFSTVYLATLRNVSSTRSYAVKHLTQNCEQFTIEEEFRCMNEIGGKDNVVHADYFLTNGDNCVTFIMPYMPHKKFSDYVLDMNSDETRLYMKNLFIALKRVHSFNIIHRDVKPGNFLYNRETKQFLLVDFGLAQVVQNRSNESPKGAAAVDENMPIDYSKKRKRRESPNDKEKKTPVKRNKRTALKLKDSNVKISEICNGLGNANLPNNEVSIPVPNSEKRQGARFVEKQFPNKSNAGKIMLKSGLMNSVNRISPRRRKLFNETSLDAKNNVPDLVTGVPHQSISLLNGSMEENKAKPSSNGAKALPDKSFTPLVPSRSSLGNFVQVRNSKVIRQCEMLKSKSTDLFQKPKPRTSCISAHCSCSGRGAICAMCSSRSKMIAPRAGTPGFRPPEVLFKHLNQTTAVDMWAAGVILLCILSGCYPFFKSPSDLVALAEIMTVFGTEPVIKIAAKFDRRVVCSDRKKGVDLKKMCKILRARTTKKTVIEKNPNDVKCNDCFQTIREDGCLCISDDPAEQSTKNEDDPDCEFPNSAFDLLKRLLDLDPTTRITAAEALEHPFILGL